MKFNINNEIVRKGLNVSKTLGKAILWEGVKGVLLKSAANMITTSFDKGLDGVKKMTLDDLVGNTKKQKVINVVPETEIESKPKEKTKVVIDGEFEVLEKDTQI